MFICLFSQLFITSVIALDIPNDICLAFSLHLPVVLLSFYDVQTHTTILNNFLEYAYLLTFCKVLVLISLKPATDRYPSHQH